MSRWLRTCDKVLKDGLTLAKWRHLRSQLAYGQLAISWTSLKKTTKKQQKLFKYVRRRSTWCLSPQKPVPIMTGRAPTPSNQRLDSGYHSPSVTSSTLICSSAAARTSWTGDRMAVRVSMRASFSPCWTGPAAGPGRALPGALMLCLYSRLAIQTAQPAELRRGQADNHSHGGGSAPMHGNVEVGFSRRKYIPSSGWAHVFLFSNL